MASYRRDPHQPTPAYLAFWQARHVCTLTTLRADGTPHVVPVSATYDPEAGLARVIATRTSAKVRHVRAGDAAAGGAGAPVAICQFDGPTWATLEGRAVIRTEADLVADAEHRYELRYGRPPRPNPHRVLIEVRLTGALGNC